MLSLRVAKRPEAQRNVEICLLGDWAAVCGGKEWLALVQTWDLLGLQGSHVQASVLESSPCFNSMIISGVVTLGSLQFASRAADSWKITSSVLTFLFWAGFHQSLRNSSEPWGTRARRLHTTVLDTPRAVQKCQLPQGCRKPDLSTTFLERQTQTEKKHFGWLRWSNLSQAVVWSQETIYWGPDPLPYSRSSSLFISSYHMLDNSQVLYPVAFHRPYLPLLPHVLHQNLAKSFSAEDYFFLSFCQSNEIEVCQESVLIF